MKLKMWKQTKKFSIRDIVWDLKLKELEPKVEWQEVEDQKKSFLSHNHEEFEKKSLGKRKDFIPQKWDHTILSLQNGTNPSRLLWTPWKGDSRIKSITLRGSGPLGEECREDGFDAVAVARRVAMGVPTEEFRQLVSSWDFPLFHQSGTVNVFSLLKTRWERKRLRTDRTFSVGHCCWQVIDRNSRGWF
jgi:hypothetical protein